MKKQLALWLALVLLVSVLAGCSGKSTDTGIPAAAFSTQSVLTAVTSLSARKACPKWQS